MKGLTSHERAIFNGIRKQFPGQIISPGKLRLEATITNASAIIDVPVLEDSIQPTKTETRLNKNDLFFMVSLGVFIANVETGKEGIAVLQTYPNKTVFAAATGFVPDHLEVIYNSKIKMAVGPTEFISNLDTNRFRRVPTTQQSSASNATEFMEEDNFQDLPTHYKLRGTDQINLGLSVPLFAGIQMESVVATHQHKLILVPKGFIIKNGANLKEAAGAAGGGRKRRPAQQA